MKQMNQENVLPIFLPDNKAIQRLEIPGVDEKFRQFYSTVSSEYKPQPLFRSLFERTDAVLERARRTSDSSTTQGSELTFTREFLGALVNEMVSLPGDSALVRGLMYEVNEYFNGRLTRLSGDMAEVATTYSPYSENLSTAAARAAHALIQTRDYIDLLAYEIGFPGKTKDSRENWQKQIKAQLESIDFTLLPEDEKVIAKQVQRIFVLEQERIKAIQSTEEKTAECKRQYSVEAEKSRPNPFKLAEIKAELQRQEWCLTLEQRNRQLEHLHNGLTGVQQLVTVGMKLTQCDDHKIERVQYYCEAGRQVLTLGQRLLTLARCALRGGLSLSLLGPFGAVAGSIYGLYELYAQEPRVDALKQNLQQILDQTTLLSRQIAASNQAISAQLQHLYRGVIAGFDFLERSQQHRHEQMLSILLDMKSELKQQGERIQQNVTSLHIEMQASMQAIYEQAYELHRDNASGLVAGTEIIGAADYHKMITRFCTHAIGSKKAPLAGEYRPVTRSDELDADYLTRLADAVFQHGTERAINPLVNMAAAPGFGISTQGALINPSAWSTRVFDFLYFLKRAPRHSFTQEQLQVFTKIIAEGLRVEQFICALKCNQPIFQFLFAGYHDSLLAIKLAMRSIILRYAYSEARSPEVKDDNERMRLLRTTVLEKLYPWSKELVQIRQAITRSEQLIADVKQSQGDAENKLTESRVAFIQHSGYEHVQVVIAIPEIKNRETNTLYIFDQNGTIDICSISIEPPRRLNPEQSQQLRQTLTQQAEEKTRGGVIVRVWVSGGRGRSGRYENRIKERPEIARIQEIEQICGCAQSGQSHFAEQSKFTEEKASLLKYISSEHFIGFFPGFNFFTSLFSGLYSQAEGLYGTAIRYHNVGMNARGSWRDVLRYQSILESYIHPQLTRAAQQLTSYQKAKDRFSVLAAQEDKSLNDDDVIRDYLTRYRDTLPPVDLASRHELPERIRTAAETKGSALQQAIARANTFYILINAYSALAFRREYSTDPAMRYWLQTALWGEAQWQTQWRMPLLPGDDVSANAQLLTYWRLVETQLPQQAREADAFFASYIVRAQQAAKEKTLNAAYPAIDDAFRQLEQLRLLLFPAVDFGLASYLTPRASFPAAVNEAKRPTIFRMSSASRSAAAFACDARLFQVCQREGTRVANCIGEHKGRRFEFGEYKIRGDGNCGFTALGVSRNEAVRILQALVKNPVISVELGKELLLSFDNYINSKGVEVNPTQYMPPALQAEVKRMYEQLKAYEDGLERKLARIRPRLEKYREALGGTLDEKTVLHVLKTNPSLSSSIPIEEVNAILDARRQYEVLKHNFSRPDILTTYINSYDINDRGLWLGLTSMHYIAHAKGIGLQVWRSGEEKGSGAEKIKILHLADEYLLQPSTPESNIIYTVFNGSHFNFLMQELTSAVLSESKAKEKESKEAPSFVPMAAPSSAQASVPLSDRSHPVSRAEPDPPISHFLDESDAAPSRRRRRADEAAYNQGDISPPPARIRRSGSSPRLFSSQPTAIPLTQHDLSHPGESPQP